MTTTQSFAVFTLTWVLAYIASTTSNNLDSRRFTPEQRSQLAPGAAEFLALLRLAGSLMPVAVAVFGLFRFKWYLVLLAVPLTFGGALVLGLIMSIALRSINFVHRSILLLFVSVAMLIVAMVLI